ncbi:MAG: hypothetical protein PHH85_09030 [Candidatus Methanoperedens sp.]|nr:hypothetical protein [Candidatus Methanoperedens sp.]
MLDQQIQELTEIMAAWPISEIKIVKTICDRLIEQDEKRIKAGLN